MRAEIGALGTELKGDIATLKVDEATWIVMAIIVDSLGMAGLVITLIKITLIKIIK